MNTKQPKTRRELIAELEEIICLLDDARDLEDRAVIKRYAPQATRIREELIERYGDDYHMSSAL